MVQFFKVGATSPADIALYSTLRLRMVDQQLRGRGIADERVLDAMSRVPRHEFAPPGYRDQAYEDHPLPIGEGQTISQPYIVALMLEVLALAPTDKVLEVGTGSGYVTALLAEMTAQVVSIERHSALADGARGVLASMDYQSVRIMAGDGTRGLPEFAPYDAIIVSAAALQPPPALVTQLAEDGRMIIPIGPDASQQLHLIQMRNGEPTTALRELCRFVPLISEKRP